MDTTTLTYDSAMERLKAIVARLEGEEALAVEDYKHLAEEAKQLLAFCRQQLTSIEEEMKETVNNERRGAAN